MFKKLFIISSVVMLSACSTMQSTSKTEDSPIKAEFLGGSLKMTYDKKSGEVKMIESMATAKVASTLPGAVEESFTLATMRARKQIVEFMKTEVESENFSDVIYDTLQKSETADKEKTQSVNQNVTQAVKQSIRQKSSGILKGTFVAEKVYDESTKTVRVIVRSSDEDVQVAKRVTRMMGQ